MSVFSKNKINNFKSKWKETPRVISVTVLLCIVTTLHRKFKTMVLRSWYHEHIKTKNWELVTTNVYVVKYEYVVSFVYTPSLGGGGSYCIHTHGRAHVEIQKQWEYGILL
jgi:hypothetical protein